MAGFTFETTPRILCEDGAAARLGTLASELRVRRVLIVTDAGLVASGAVDPASASLEAAGVETVLFTDVEADPPQRIVEAVVDQARAAEVDGVVGLGGGSSLDTAKLAALLAATPQRLDDIYGVGLAHGPRLPLIQVPTTAGTGSEVTPIAIVTTPDHQKKGVVSPLLLPDVAILDPLLTLSLPPRVTAMTGVDAMVHAIEAYTSRHRKNPVSDSLAIAALKLLRGAIRRAVSDGADVDSRRDMLTGAMLAGMAFANAPVAAVHALAYPLGGLFHVPHGLANALVLRPVLAFNLPAAEGAYAELASALGLEPTARALVEEVTAILSDMPFERRLGDVGVRRQDLNRLAADAMQVQRLLVNNPREVTYEDALAIYEQVL
jgi:alcohol dehydrogenase class IV